MRAESCQHSAEEDHLRRLRASDEKSCSQLAAHLQINVKLSAKHHSLCQLGHLLPFGYLETRPASKICFRRFSAQFCLSSGSLTTISAWMMTQFEPFLCLLSSQLAFDCLEQALQIAQD